MSINATIVSLFACDIGDIVPREKAPPHHRATWRTVFRVLCARNIKRPGSCAGDIGYMVKAGGRLRDRPKLSGRSRGRLYFNCCIIMILCDFKSPHLARHAAREDREHARQPQQLAALSTLVSPLSISAIASFGIYDHGKGTCRTSKICFLRLPSVECGSSTDMASFICSPGEGVSRKFGGTFSIRSSERLRNGRVEESLPPLHHCLSLNSRWAAAYNALGIAYGLLQRHRESENAFAMAVEIGGTIDACTNLAVAIEKQERISEAIECHGAAVRQNPNHAVSHFNFGNLLRASGRLRRSTPVIRNRRQPPAVTCSSMEQFGRIV